MDTKGPRGLGGSPANLWLFVEDSDALFKRATGAGAQVRMPMTDQFWGDRAGSITDPAATHGGSRHARKISRAPNWISGPSSFTDRWRTEGHIRPCKSLSVQVLRARRLAWILLWIRMSPRLSLGGHQ